MKRDRHWQIMQLLLQNRRITIKELCEHFEISVETARRDLNALEEEGIVTRVYGGAMLIDNTNMPNLMPPWSSRLTQNLDEKRAIAREMLKWIPDHSIIALDSGTSAFELAKLLHKKKDLTILLNDLRVAAELSNNTEHTIYYIGGVLKKDDMITTGFLATDFLDHFSQIDLAIFSADGFDVNIGVTDYNVEMGKLKMAILKKANQVFLGIDHSKFSNNAFYKVCGVDKLNMVITGIQAPSDSIHALKKIGIQTILVNE